MSWDEYEEKIADAFRQLDAKKERDEYLAGKGELCVCKVCGNKDYHGFPGAGDWVDATLCAICAHEKQGSEINGQLDA